ncbi:MAG: RICIN domain-containing protein, partial [Eggerthellaceae bacterium]|nr:RICIN domain-containing protein [Eggerthellaceae bacterium]
APALTSTAAPANTTDAGLANGVYVISSALRSSAVLDVCGGSASKGAKLQLWDSNTTPAQRWYIEKLGNSGYYKISNVGSGKVLDVSGGSKKAGTRIQQYTWNNTPAQKWKITKTSGGLTITSALSYKLVLDVSGANKNNGAAVQTYTANGSKAQVWKFTAVKQTLPNGVYTFANVGSGKVLDTAGGGIENGANIQQYRFNQSVAQYYSARFNTKTGYYNLYAINSGLALDVAGASYANGANVWLYASNGTAAQKWTIIANSDGSYTLRNALSGKALDVVGASSANGANVQMYDANGTLAQKWRAKKVTNWFPNGVYSFVNNHNTKTALGVAKSSRSAGANVQSAARADTDWAQCWVVVQDKKNPGYYTIRNLNSRMMLEVQGGKAVDGANVQQAGKKASDAQLWKPLAVSNGVMWVSKLNDSVVIDMAGAGKAAGTNVQLYKRNNTSAQKFRLKQQSVTALLKSTALVVRNMDTNLVLDIAGGSSADGAAVQEYTFNNSSAQKFRFKSNGSGFSLINAKSSKALDIDTNTKTKIQQWSSSNATNQRWTVKFDLATATFTLQSAYTGKRLDGAGGTLRQKAAASSDAQRWILQPTTADYFRVYLNSGHGWNSNGNGAWDTGARGAGVEEAVFASDLCDRIIKIGREQYGLDIVDGRPYKLAYWDRLPKAVELGCSCIFSIHFDAGGGSGPMTMVGVQGRHPASLTFEGIMGKHLYAALPGLTHRGLFYRDDITCVNGSIPAVLVEVCFMDNPSDVAYYQPRRDTVARELAAGLYEASQVQSLRKTV